MEDRKTFAIPEGYEAVRDAEGRATGEVRPVNDPVALTNERKGQHGDWLVQSRLSAHLKHEMQQSPNWMGALDPGQREALDMIAVKISRILSGDPNHADHWDDIAGYAYLGKGGHGK